MKIILTGGTGFIGYSLIDALLREKHSVVLLTRNAGKISRPDPLLSVESWDSKSLGPWAEKVDGADAVINLAGEAVAHKRWSPEQKELIALSRIDSTRAIVDAIQNCRNKPSVLINASAVGYYGDVESGDVTEAHPKGQGFLADVCAQWESEAKRAEIFGVRVVLLRIGVVLEKGGGALAKMLFPFEIFAGGPLGSGNQWFPWIHREDMINMIVYALQNPAVKGPANCAAPEPVTMKEFCQKLGHAMHRPSWAPVPEFALKIMFGEMSEILLTGQRIIPKKFQETGYSFRHPRLEEALSSILKD